MTGAATDAQIGGFLVGLRAKGETVDEITAAATVMRRLATPVDVTVENVVDTCGTGGSGSNKFNVSTASALWHQLRAWQLPNMAIVRPRAKAGVQMYWRSLAQKLC